MPAVYHENRVMNNNERMEWKSKGGGYALGQEENGEKWSEEFIGEMNGSD